MTRLTLKILKEEIDNINQRIDPPKKDNKKLFKIGYYLLYLIATCVIAISTFYYWKLSDKMITLQSDYYQKTIRPFVHLDSILLFPKIHNDSLFISVLYQITNSGSQPALSVQKKLYFSNKKDDEFNVPFEKQGVKNALYPYKIMETPKLRRKYSFDYLTKNKYIHIHIVYKDMSGREYFYKEILLLRNLSFKNGQLHSGIVPLWVRIN